MLATSSARITVTRPYSAIPQPVVTYYKLGDSGRYVYSDGYLYEVDPATYAVTKVIDTWSH